MSECKIAQNLIEFRTAKGLTQAKLAEELAVSDKVISKWENGASMPDLNMLVALADFYGVSTDILLGLAKEDKKNIFEEIQGDFSPLGWAQSIVRAFEVSKTMIPVMFKKVDDENDESNNIEDYLPKSSSAARNRIMTPEFYNFTVNSEHANMAVMLLRNKDNFSWLKDVESQKKMTELFAFLSDVDVLSVIYFIHSESCPQNFTADYVARNTGVSVDKVTCILKAAEKYELCFKTTAHLVSGKIDIYESFGNGDLLSLVTFAYEQTCGAKAYEFHFTSECKMIGGDRL